MGESSSANESEADTSPAETEPSAASSEAAPADAKPAPAASEDATGEAATTGSESAPADADAKPKKKKRRKKEAPVDRARDPIGPDGRERPAFVLDYPSDPELDRLVKAFEIGNYAFVREHAPELAEKASDARVRAAAGELARRIEPDPLVKVLLAMSLTLFFVLAFWAYKTHGN